MRDKTADSYRSAGIALKTDRPFDQEGERRNPWWGDPSYRILPSATTSQDVRLYHLHIDPSCAEQDLSCLFPLGRLPELAQAGEIGRMAARHYSIMGYILGRSSTWPRRRPRSFVT
jgi:D-proline reductase (dithiol) PrdB